jgi:hypothetical protein
MIPTLQLGGLGRARSSGTLDPYYSSVASLLHFDAADGATTFTDQKGKTWGAAGDAQIDTSQSKWGGSSLLVDGTVDLIATATSADFDFGSGDFTIEGWARTAGTPGTTGCLVGRWGSAGNRQFVVAVASSRRMYASLTADGTTEIDIVSANDVFPTTTWFHFAYVRNGSALACYVDGVSVGSDTFGGTMFSSSADVSIGGNAANQLFNGWIDDVRITKGVARYTAGFTPPSGPFPNS